METISKRANIKEGKYYKNVKIKNHRMLVLYYLLTRKKVSLLDIINDSRFYTFNTRLSDVERDFGNITKKEFVPFVNELGNYGEYKVYSLSISKKKAFQILKEMAK